MKDILAMTRQELEKVPWRKEWNVDVICDSLIILPSRKSHDSGYRLLDFVAVSNLHPMCRVSGCSDVLHIEGIGGMGYGWVNKLPEGCPSMIRCVGWSMDCLQKSGLMRIFAHGYNIRCGAALSSFEIFSVATKRELERREKYERQPLKCVDNE